MKRWYSTKTSWIAIIVTIAPVIFALSRDSVLASISKKLNLNKVPVVSQSEKVCSGTLCETVSGFKVDRDIWIKLKHPAVGYYGAQLDSYIRVGGINVDQIFSESEVRFTWPRFRIFTIENLSQTRADPVEVVSVSPIGTKKIGMDSPFLYFGERGDLETLQFVYSLYNIHLYLLLALIVIALGMTIVFSSQAGSDIDVREVYIGACISAFALILFTTVFDDVLLAIHVPRGFVGNLRRIFWAPALVVHLLPKSRFRVSVVGLWIVWVIGASLDTTVQDFFLYQTYRWAVFLIVALGAVIMLRDRSKRFALPYICLAAFDCASLHGIIPIKSAIYVSPLGICGLFVSAHLREILSVFEHHRYWYERRNLTRRMQELRSSRSVDRKQWLELLTEVCKSLSSAVNASKVSLCYLGFDSPLIISLDKELIKQFEDGQLPPVFARVVQTKESLWWIKDTELTAYLPGRSLRRKDVYKSNRAIVLPILVGGEAYGAMALTDFDGLEEIMDSEDKRHQIESVVTSFLDLISVQLVKKRETSEVHVQKQASEIIRSYSQEAIFARSSLEAIDKFLETFTKLIPSGAMYFEFDPNTERLHLLAAVNIPTDQVNQWREIPFRARPTNRVSPFAITINERRSVFVDNIQSFFNFLTPQSVDVLTASGTRGFVCAPVCFGDSVLGLVCAIDSPRDRPLVSEVATLLDLPLKYLSYQLEQHRMQSALVTQEQTLARFVDPRLAELITHSKSESELVIGEVEPALLIIHDLRGSTPASKRVSDAKELAAKFAQFYQKSAAIAAEYGAYFDKGHGDGTITTLPTKRNSNGSGLELALRILDEADREAKRALGTEGSIVCVHRGEPFRGVLGTARRISWDVIGNEVSAAFSIEKVAKKHAGIVFAVSRMVIDLESSEVQVILNECATKEMIVDGHDGTVLGFDDAAVNQIRMRLFNKGLCQVA